VKYAFIEAHREEYGIVSMCHIFKIARAGFYAWTHQPESKRTTEDQRLLSLIRDSYAASGGIYGSPRVHMDLRETGESCGVHRVARIMREYKIKAVRGYKSPRHRFGKPAQVAPNRLKQQFTVDEADKAWVTDITYIRTWQGWLYLATVIDLYSRKVIGWSMKSSLAKEIVLDALLMAIWRRKPSEPVIIHSDQGSQYGSDDWQRFCKQHSLLPSMSRRGNCYDNAVAESFFSSLKKERIRKKIYKNRDEARAEIFDYIEMFYNRKRRHSHLGGMSPEDFEMSSVKAL